MSQSAKYVTRGEFDPVKASLERLSDRVDHLTIRVDVLANELHHLTARVADLAEEMNARFDAVDARFDAVDARFDRLEKAVADGNAALMSAILKLAS